MNDIKSSDWNITRCNFNYQIGETLIVKNKNEKEFYNKITLRNLFADMIKGNTLSYPANPPLFDCELGYNELVEFFFGFKMKEEADGNSQNIKIQKNNNSYLSNFLSCSKNSNNLFTRFFYTIKENNYRGKIKDISAIVTDMEEKCEVFIGRYSHKSTSQNLNTFSNTFLSAIVNELEKLNGKTQEIDSGISAKKDILRNYLEIIKENNAKLFARIMLIAAFRIDKMTPSILFEIIMGSDHERATDNEGDNYYVRSLLAQSAELKNDYIGKAYKQITDETKYTKQIMLSYAKAAIAEKDYKKASDALVRLTLEFPDYGEGYRLLANCYEGQAGNGVPDNAVSENYEQAARLRDAEALLWISKKILDSDAEDKSTAVEYCKSVLESEKGNSASHCGKAAFILAKLSQSAEDTVEYFRLSANYGYVPAISEVRAIEKNKRAIAESKIDPDDNTNKNSVFLTNCPSLNDRVLNQFKPEEYRIYSVAQSPELPYITIGDFIKENYKVFNRDVHFPKQSIFAFCSDDETRNISDTLLLLDHLYNITIDIDPNNSKSGAAVKNDFIESIEIFLSASYETASMLVDASIADMGGSTWFKVRIFDKNKVTARWLLTAHPLFAPAISSRENSANLVAFGSTPFIYSLIKEATSCCYMSTCAPKLTVIDNDVSQAERKFGREAYGFTLAPIKNKIYPCFLKLDLSGCDLEREICENTKSEVSHKIAQGNYFVIDVGSDFENILLAKRLRTYLLRSDENFRRFPFIAVRVSDPRNAYLAERLTVGNKKPDGSSWFNSYGLCVFTDRTPSFAEPDTVEHLGLNIHLSYYGKDVEAGKKAYYSSSYNVDSSESAAVGLIYKMFDCGVFFKDPSDYSSMNLNILRSLASEYSKKIESDEELLKKCASTEQTRFNHYLLTNGWSYAFPRQVQAYIKESNSTSHKQELAKLHPFLCDFEDLQEKYDELKSNLDIQGLRNPIDSTVGTVRNVTEYFKPFETKRKKNIKER